MRLPILETDRLRVRPFEQGDLDAVQEILFDEVAAGEADGESGGLREELRQWLEWTALSYQELDRLNQPPFGDRAIVLKETGKVVGVCGFAPCLSPFGVLPGCGSAGADAPIDLTWIEVGLYWAVSRSNRRRGFATEAARALIDFAFNSLNLKRIVATTTYENAPSIRVMNKLGMQLERNPRPEPPWLQLVGILNHPRFRAGRASH
jgi:RimJ/RimL family protein N-acetyltransferase